MATGENRLFIVSKISKKTLKCLGLLVFRTRTAQRQFVKDNGTRHVRYYAVPARATWGPEQ